MNEKGLIWQERASKSDHIASVWMCKVSAPVTRTVLADACVSLSFIKNDGKARVVIIGPRTKPHEETFVAGYECMTIRLQPGVRLKGFSAQEFTNRELTLEVDTKGLFTFEGMKLRFPGFHDAEQLIKQFQAAGYISGEMIGYVLMAKALSNRTYSRFVKRTTGLTPYQLHQLQRSHRVLRLLKQGMSATEVAFELDFVDQSHLTSSLDIHLSSFATCHRPRNSVQNIQFLSLVLCYTEFINQKGQVV